MSKVDYDLKREFRPGAELYGFRSIRVEDVPKMGIVAIEMKHEKSGARLLHLASDDSENLFAIALRTPPPDDTGLPHILEHSVLCGSRRYPVKDPFVELLKTSLATFLNASTYPDRTLYPCASMNHADFINLMRVYADAVFFPVLTEDTLRQEGHHLEVLPDGKLTFKGVVYNEMRGVYSDPENILGRHVQRLLFAGNAYGLDFGGDPAVIPTLRFEDFIAFHKAYYHPSNAWIFTYGDIDPKQTLVILDQEYLGEFDAGEVDSTIASLSAWTAPRQATFPYPLDADDDPAGKTDVSVSFIASDRRDLLVNLALKVIDSYFLDNSASPLRKALIDSKLGDELGASGYADYQRDTFFEVSLKGSEPEKAAAVEQLILDVILREVEQGFDKDKIASAMHQLELSAREIRPQHPLRLMDRTFASWLYDSDPLLQLRVAERLDELRETVSRDTGYLENLTRKWLLDNPGRLRVTLVPDKGYMERKEREQDAAMDKRLRAMSPAQLEAVKKTAERLEEEQSKGNSPEALATLPKLTLGDVSPQPIPLDYVPRSAGGFEILDVPMQSGGVGYLQLCLDLGYMDEELLDYLPLFTETLGKCGAAGLDYAAMAEREAACTGGLEFGAGITSHVAGPDRARLRMTGWFKALESEWDNALGVFADRLFRPEFEDKERLRDIILQSRVAWRNQVVPAGNAYAALYAGRNLTPAMALSERLGGCGQARFIDRLASKAEHNLDGIIDRLHAIREQVMARAVLHASQVGSPAVFAKTTAWIDANAGHFLLKGNAVNPPRPVPSADPVLIGLAAPADVAFVSRVLPGPSMDSPEAPALLLLGLQLSYGYLWNEIRVKGGAYGARAVFDGARGVFQFTSFRDPSINRTLATYDRVPEFVAKTMDLSPHGLEQAVIGTIKTLDQPMRPASAAPLALTRHLGGETPEFRQSFRSRLLALTARDVRRAAETVFAGLAAAPVCALSSREKISAENRAGDSRDLRIEPLWDNGG